MLEYFDVLDSFGHRIEVDLSNSKWTNVSWPSKVTQQCTDALNVIAAAKDKYLNDMLSEQKRFEEHLVNLEKEVETFGAYDDISQVEEVSKHAVAVQQKCADAEAKAQLFNSREGLFEKEITDYELLGKVKKTFEPYNNLWQTTATWIKAYHDWTEGNFLAIDAEGCEQQVETNLTTISKTVRFFEQQGMPAQGKIANEIKKQVTQVSRS